MKKLFYYVIVKEESGKHYAFAETAGEEVNLVPWVERYHATSINACKSRMEAEKLALYWNECYKENGTNLY